MLISNYEFRIGINMYIPVDRHHDPLPDVGPDRLAGFSLGNDGTDMGQSAKSLSLSGCVSASNDVVDQAALVLRRHRS